MKDGGPAFPRPASEFTKNGTLADGNDARPDQEGMTLRDYFAAKALQAILSFPESVANLSEQATESKVDPTEIAASIAYQHADAMLQERMAP